MWKWEWMEWTSEWWVGVNGHRASSQPHSCPFRIHQKPQPLQLELGPSRLVLSGCTCAEYLQVASPMCNAGLGIVGIYRKAKIALKPGTAVAENALLA